MKWVFQELSQGILNGEQVRRLANGKGLKCERNNFWKLIRNPMYCGIIVVPPFENEEMQFVKAQHEPLITESLFYEVQDVLNGNKRKVASKVVADDNLPLRGFLECPTCNRMLTGSASKGRHNYYYYYHCSGSHCKSRYKAEDVNGYFENYLGNFQLNPNVGELFKMVVLDYYRSANREELDERKFIATKIEEQEKILSNARKRFMTEEIDVEDFKAIKIGCSEQLKRLDAKLSELPAKSDGLKRVEGLLDVLIERYSDIKSKYKVASLEDKRNIIGSMYPENLQFDGTQHRTANLNTVLELILLINNNIEGKKRGERYTNLHLSPLVARRGIEPPVSRMKI